MRVYFRAHTLSLKRHATGLPLRNAGMNCHPADGFNQRVVSPVDYLCRANLSSGIDDEFHHFRVL